MCIVIDINVLTSVFDENCKEYSEFKPVKEWIIKGNGKVIFGGSKYKQELKKLNKILKLLLELDKKRKIIRLDDEEVDKKELEIIKVNQNSDLDDAHIIAIIIISKCKLVCTHDARSFRFIKDKTFYPKRFFRPKIYSKYSNSNLLCEKNIVSICKKCEDTQ